MVGAFHWTQMVFSGESPGILWPNQPLQPPPFVDFLMLNNTSFFLLVSYLLQPLEITKCNEFLFKLVTVLLNTVQKLHRAKYQSSQVQYKSNK